MPFYKDTQKPLNEFEMKFWSTQHGLTLLLLFCDTCVELAWDRVGIHVRTLENVVTTSPLCALCGKSQSNLTVPQGHACSLAHM